MADGKHLSDKGNKALSKFLKEQIKLENIGRIHLFRGDDRKYVNMIVEV